MERFGSVEEHEGFGDGLYRALSYAVGLPSSIKGRRLENRLRVRARVAWDYYESVALGWDWCAAHWDDPALKRIKGKLASGKAIEASDLDFPRTLAYLDGVERKSFEDSVIEAATYFFEESDNAIPTADEALDSAERGKVKALREARGVARGWGWVAENWGTDECEALIGRLKP